MAATPSAERAPAGWKGAAATRLRYCTHYGEGKRASAWDPALFVLGTLYHALMATLLRTPVHVFLKDALLR